MSSKLAVDPNTIYSRGEAAHLMGVSLTTLKQLIRSGQLVVSRPDGIRRVFIKGSSILTMLDRTTLVPSRMSGNSFKNSFFNERFAFASKYPVQSTSIGKSTGTFDTLWRRNGQSNSEALRDKRITHARRHATTVAKNTAVMRRGDTR